MAKDKVLVSVPRDHASALEILRLGLSLLGETWPVAASVPERSRLALAGGVVTIMRQPTLRAAGATRFTPHGCHLADFSPPGS